MNKRKPVDRICEECKQLIKEQITRHIGLPAHPYVYICVGECCISDIVKATLCMYDATLNETSLEDLPYE